MIAEEKQFSTSIPGALVKGECQELMAHARVTGGRMVSSKQTRVNTMSERARKENQCISNPERCAKLDGTDVLLKDGIGARHRVGEHSTPPPADISQKLAI